MKDDEILHKKVALEVASIFNRFRIDNKYIPMVQEHILYEINKYRLQRGTKELNRLSLAATLNKLAGDRLLIRAKHGFPCEGNIWIKPEPLGNTKTLIESLRDKMALMQDYEREDFMRNLLAGYCPFCYTDSLPCYCTHDD